MKRHLIIAAVVGLFTTVSLPVSASCSLTDHYCESEYESEQDDYNPFESHNRMMEQMDEERRHEETLDAIRSLRSCDDIWPIEKQVHARTYGQCQ